MKPKVFVVTCHSWFSLTLMAAGLPPTQHPISVLFSIPFLQLDSQVTWSKSLPVSEPRFPRVRNEVRTEQNFSASTWSEERAVLCAFEGGGRGDSLD